MHTTDKEETGENNRDIMFAHIGINKGSNIQQTLGLTVSAVVDKCRNTTKRTCSIK